MNKLIVILGPTASGKSDLAVKIAKKFNGEVVSADSRQVYKGMDIGTGKITKKEMKGILHHLLDVASPKRRYTVAQYKKAALEAIKKIQKKKKKGKKGKIGTVPKGGTVPILCGGTGFYIQAVVDGLVIPEVKPDWKLRTKLEKKTTQELFAQLKKFDPRRAKTIDKNNRRRLIRALEIVIKTGQPVPKLKKEKPEFNVLLIGVKKSAEELEKLIKKRLIKRMHQDMLAEVKKLRQNGISWQRLEEFGLEYRWLARYLQRKISYQEMLEKLQKDIEHFAKRQMTWFKRNKRINWIKNKAEAEKAIKKFLKNKGSAL